MVGLFPCFFSLFKKLPMRPQLRLFDGSPDTTPHLTSSVMELQILLQRRGYRMQLDGVLGTYTENVVRQFQRARGLPANGTVDSFTWAELTKNLVTGLDFPLPTTLAVTDRFMLQELAEYRKYKALVQYCAQYYGLPVAVLAGIGSQESRWGLALTPPGPTGTGDHGHGRGLFQVDDRWHPQHIASGDWQIPSKHIPYAAALLKQNLNGFAKATQQVGLTLLRGGVAAYNKGLKTVVDNWNAGRDLDFATHKNIPYANLVFNRAGWFLLADR
jgi:hypothetical protein